MNKVSVRFRARDAAAYFFVVLVSMIAAFELRFEFSISRANRPLMLIGIALAILVKFPIFYLFGMHRSMRMFADVSDMFRLLANNLVASVLFFACAVAYVGRIFPRSIPLIDFLACCLLTVLVRYSAKLYSEAVIWKRGPEKKKSILIYGAGAAGVTLLREIRENQKLGYRVVGFLDDDPAKRGARVLDTGVLGTGAEAAAIVSHLNRRKTNVEEIVIAMPSATGGERRAALEHCQSTAVPCKTIPGLGELLTRKVLAEQIRSVSVTDLLGRPPVLLEEAPIRSHMARRCVLITGAAGSIGSELCRQVASFSPTRLIALDQAESELFKIESELREQFPSLDLVAAVGDIRDPRRLKEIFDQNDIESVYHAAAYKHVPMMERHVLEAVHNNVVGTWNLINAIQHRGVSSFLMISSDKAVNPTSVMGATKRVCELLVAASSILGSTRCVSVRFGNVLGSNGSVVPIFQSQIAAGGPVRVTHPDMQRYFMTASEAVSLVLQASTMGTASEIFVLDMGEPVRIVDLAVNMIRLAGLAPHRDIEIRFTGLRPGEKLFEEINAASEKMLPTYHHKIKIFEQALPDWGTITEWVSRARTLMAHRMDAALVDHISELVPEYHPSERWTKKRVASYTNGLAAAAAGADAQLTA